MISSLLFQSHCTHEYNDVNSRSSLSTFSLLSQTTSCEERHRCQEQFVGMKTKWGRVCVCGEIDAKISNPKAGKHKVRRLTRITTSRLHSTRWSQQTIMAMQDVWSQKTVCNGNARRVKKKKILVTAYHDLQRCPNDFVRQSTAWIAFYRLMNLARPTFSDKEFKPCLAATSKSTFFLHV